MKSLLILLLLTFTLTAIPFKVVGYSYMTDPIANDIDYSNYTHVIGSFINSDKDGNITYQTWVPENEILDVLKRAEEAGAVPMIALGTTPAGWEMTKDASTRAHFINNLLRWCDENGVKGIDLDLEGTAEEFNWGNPGTFFPEPYESLAVELRAAMPDTMLLTSAVGSSSRTGTQWSDIFIDQLDWINVMIYDRALSWESSPVENHSTYDGHVEACIYWHESRGVPKEKIVPGVPFYARAWDRDNNRIYREAPGWDVTTWDYKHFINRYPTERDQDTIDFPATDSIKYKRAEGVTGKGTLFFNSLGMIKRKTEWTIDNNYAGIMVWHIDGDVPTNDSNSLLKAIETTVNGDDVKIDHISDKNSINRITTIDNRLSLNLPSGEYRICLNDLRGREVALLKNGFLHSGSTLKLSSYAKGVYILNINSHSLELSIQNKILIH